MQDATPQHAPTPGEDVASPGVRKRSRLAWAIIALTSAALISAIGVGVWFAFLSPQASEASLSAATTRVATGENIALTGVITPERAGRGVELQHRPAADAEWRTISSSVTTSDGAFTLNVDSGQNPGPMQYRAVALKEGRLIAAQSPVVDIRVLAPTVLSASPPRRARTDRRAAITGTLFPAAERHVVAEVSTDGQATWTQIGSATTALDGKFRIRFTHDERLSGVLRIRADDTAEAAAATTDPAPFEVEDYEAAGKVYLRAVSESNALVAVQDSIDFGDVATSRAHYSAIADAAEIMMRTLQRYKHWPHEVRPVVRSMIDATRVEIDTYRNMAKADTLDEMSSIFYDSALASADRTSDASKIRSILGLPERPAT